MSSLSGRNDARLVLLPGLGVDARIFAPQFEVFERLEVPRWIAPEPGESLPEYAARLAASWDPTPPFYLGGVSFGGMVAIEASRHLRPEAVFLIASCRGPHGVSRLIRFEERIGRLTPDWLVRLLMRPAVWALAHYEHLSVDQRKLMHEIVRDSDMDMLRWGGRAIVEWGSAGDFRPPDLPVHQLHGGRDRIIPLIREDAERAIPEGGHLINMTHADQVNEFLSKHMMPACGAGQ